MNPGRNLPWTDGLAGLTAGVVFLSAYPFWAWLYGCSAGFVVFLATVNLAYSTIGLSLGPRLPRPRRWVQFLIAANLMWGVVCFALAAWTLGSVGILGTIHLVLEGLFVGGLGLVERRYFEEIVGPNG